MLNFSGCMGLATKYIGHLQLQLDNLLCQPVGKRVIHDLRVVLKRIRALWLIHPIGSTIPFRQSFPNLRKLFRLVAQTRDLQVTLATLNTLPDFSKFPQLEKALKKEISLERKKLVQKSGSADFRHKVKNEIYIFKQYFRVASGYILKKNRKEYRNNVAFQLNAIHPKDPEQLHLLRKVLKNQLYHEEAFYLEPEKHSSFPEKTTIEKIQHFLGNWHDWLNVSLWLKKFEHSEQLPGIEALINQVERKEIALKREVFRYVKSVMNQINHNSVPKKG